jgi:hypothetical protein
MGRFASLLVAAFLFIAGLASAADNPSGAVARIESDIITLLNGIEATISRAAKETGKLGSDREAEIRTILQACNAGRPYVIDSAFVDGKGIMKIIEPGQYRQYEGSDISTQEAVIRVQRTKKPWMGNVFVSVEGVKSIDIEYPVFSDRERFLGSVSMLVKQEELIRSVVLPAKIAPSIKCWVMQNDGLLLYETDPTQMGRNLFTDPLYRDYPELIALGRRMVKEKEGRGSYTFPVHGTSNVVKKQAAWRTVRFLNNDWIIVAYSEVR